MAAWALPPVQGDQNPFALLSSKLLSQVAQNPHLNQLELLEIALWQSYRTRQDTSVMAGYLAVADQHLKQTLKAIPSDPTPRLDEALTYQLLYCHFQFRSAAIASPKDCLPSTEQIDAIQDPYKQVIVRHLTGNLLLRMGMPAKSVATHEQTLVDAKRVNFRTEYASIENSLGLAYMECGLPLRAFGHFELANESIEYSLSPLVRQVLSFNLGLSQLDANLFEDAKETFLAALPWIKESGNMRRLGIALTYLAQTYTQLGQPQTGLARLQTFLDAHATELDGDSYLLAHATMADALIATDSLDKGLAILEELLLHAMRIDNELREKDIRLQLARAKNSANQPAQALAVLAELLPQLRTQDTSQDLYTALRISANAQAALGNYADAYKDQDQASHAALSAKDNSYKTQLALLQTKLDRDHNAHQLSQSKQRENELQIQSQYSRALTIAAVVVATLLILIGYLILSRKFQRRLAERERLASHKLEEQVVERTQALESTMADRLNIEEDRRQLQQTIFEGEKLRALGQLTGGVAHDFNNLMTVVTLSAELLKNKTAADDQASQDSLNDILKAAASAADITAGLLAYARQQPLQPESIDLQDFLADVLPLFRRSLDESVDLNVQISSQQRVLVDRSQLTTCLLNLVLNAKEAMQGSGRITIAVHSRIEAMFSWIDIEVTDTGKGMPAHELSRATDPFYTTKAAGQGSGLGLSMVYGFAKQSGGDLNITSHEQRGTTVTISLPMAQTQATDVLATLPAEPLQELRGRVLVVEDQSDVREVLQRLLESLGLEVAIAVDGDRGRDYLTTQPAPDLLITDIVMPGSFDGHEVAALARKLHPELAILIISGYAKSHDSDFPFLRKPFSLNDLRKTVTELLTQSQPHNLSSQGTERQHLSGG